MISIGRFFKIIDDDNSGQINIDEFTKAVTEQKLDLSIDDIRLLFLAFDRDRSGEISYDEFLRVIRGEVSDQRLDLIQRAFQSLDRDGSGIIDYKDIQDSYSTKKHPAVIEGRKTERQVYDEFLQNFEAHHTTWKNEKPDGKITMEEWVEYYTNVSASIDSDVYFSQMMNSSWNLDKQDFSSSSESWAKHYNTVAEINHNPRV